MIRDGIKTREQIAIEFLHRVLPKEEKNIYNASYLVIEEKKCKNKVVTTFEQIVETNFADSDNGLNAYFGCSSYSQGWYLPYPEAPKHKFRTGKNAYKEKSLWLDLDCGKETSTLLSALEGLETLQSFLHSTGLPVPLTVLSGRGLHLYFTFTQPVEKLRWKRMAEQLKAITNYLKLPDIDHSRTTDAASILRLPGTNNYKDGNIYSVRVLIPGEDTEVECIENVLNIFCTKHNIVANQTKNVSETASLNILSYDKVFEGPLRDPRKIVSGCLQVRNCGSSDYPAWYRCMAVLSRCVKGNETMHYLSQQDTRRNFKYDPEKLAELWQSCLDSGCGPTTCAEFDSTNPGICDDCKFAGAVTTPLQLGDIFRSKKTFEVPAPEMLTSSPESFSYVDDNFSNMAVEAFSNDDFYIYPGDGVYYQQQITVGKGVDKTTAINPVKILNVPFYLHHKYVAHVGGQLQTSYAVRMEQAKGIKDTFYSIEQCFGHQSTAKWFCNHSATPISSKYNDLVGMLMQSYIAAMENKLPVVQMRNSFGWTSIEAGGPENQAFVFGDNMYTPKGKVPVTLGESCKQISGYQFSSAGSMEAWKKIPAMYSALDQKIAQLFMCAGFASPFMKFGVGTATNLVMYMWDAKGGKGKSSLLRAISSIWGHPKNSMGTAQDSLSARYQILAAKSNVSHCMDELTVMSPDDLADLLYTISNGIRSAKSLPGGNGLIEPGSWETIVFASSNKSVYDILERKFPHTPAAMMRVIEICCDFPSYAGTTTGKYIEETTHLVNSNYGLAGPLFLELCFKQPAIFQAVAKAGMEWVEKHRKHSDERFWGYGLGTSLAVGRILCKLGILDYDMDALDIFAQNLLRDLRVQVMDKQSSSASLLSEFLSDHLDSTLIVRSATRPDNMPDPKTLSYDAVSMDKYVANLPTRQIIARMEQKEQMAYISCKHFRDWCARRGASLSTILTELENTKAYKKGDKGQVTLGRGVAVLDRGRMLCYKFDTSAMDLPNELSLGDSSSDS